MSPRESEQEERTTQKAKRNQGIAIVGILLLIIFIGLNSNHLLSIIPTSTCTSIPNVQCGTLVNGVITSLSQVQVNSNFGPLNGEVWLVDFTLNGAGQYLAGSWTTQQLAQAVSPGSTSTQSGQVSIQATLSNQELVIPYSYSGTDLIQLREENITYPFSWFSSGAGALTTCSQINQTATNPEYTFGCSGASSDTDFANIFSAYSSQCSSNGGYTFLVSSGSAVVAGITVSQAYTIACKGVTQTDMGQIFSAGSPRAASKVTVIYSNSTGNYPLTLTDAIPENESNNNLFAQIYGYSVGSLNTYIGTTSPTVLITQQGTSDILNPVSITTIQSLDTFQTSSLSSAGVSISGVAFNNVYSLQPFINGIQQQNTQVQNLIQSTVQPTNPYGSMKVVGLYYVEGQPLNDPSIYTGASYYGIVNVTTNPIFYPQIQLLSKAATLGIQIPVVNPTIQSASPNPVIIQSGSTAPITFTVANNATVTGSAYIIVYASNGTQVAESPQFQVGASSTTAQSLTLPAYNPNMANLNEQWTATVYSSQLSSVHNSFTFGVSIKPNCPAGYTYVNNTNCISTTHTCTSGYVWNGSQCVAQCSPPSYFNSTTSTCTNPTVYSNETGTILEIIAILAAIGIVAYAFMRKRKRR